MRPTLSFLLLFFTTIYICAQDTTPPVLTSITFDPASAKTGETVSVIIEAHDEMSELSYIAVNISNSIPFHRVEVTNWNTIGENQYSNEFTVYEHDVGGEWYVSSLTLRDSESNRLFENFSAENSPATFNITATDPDTASPTLNNITFNPTSTNTGNTVSVIVEAQDDLSGLDFIQLSISNPSDQQTVTLFGSPDRWINTEENHYSQSFTIEENALGGDWYIDFVFLIDVVGNQFNKRYTAENSPATFNVTTTNPDATPPTLTDITFEPSTAQPGETVSVIVETQDELSGVNEIQVKILNPKGRQQTLLSYPLSLWTEDGINRYRYDFTLDELALSGTWYVSLVQLRDNANNYLDNAYTSDNPPYTFEVEKSLSIENHKQQKLTVYPNPLESFIHINADFSSAKIYDLHGKLQFVFHSKTADVSSLDKGFYILELFDDKKNKMATFKFIKK